MSSTYALTNGTAVTRAGFPAVAFVDPDPLLVASADVWESFELPGESGVHGSRKAVRVGQQIRTSAVNAMFAAGTVSSIAPAAGGIAGGTNVTIKGTNLRGVTGVTFGGTAATNLAVVDQNTVTCRTPAHAAGTVDVVVTDDAGPVTDTAAFVYS